MKFFRQKKEKIVVRDQTKKTIFFHYIRRKMIRVKIPTLFIEMMNNALLLLHSEEQKSTAIFCSFLLMNNRVHEYLFQNGEKHEFPISKDLINQMRTFSIVNRKKRRKLLYPAIDDISVSGRHKSQEKKKFANCYLPRTNVLPDFAENLQYGWQKKINIW